MAVRDDQVREFFVPDAVVLRRATTLLGSATASSARCAIRVAPVPAACRERIAPTTPSGKPVSATLAPWPLAHPLFVALDLAQDEGRGREILDAWTPDERWTRVW